MSRADELGTNVSNIQASLRNYYGIGSSRATEVKAPKGEPSADKSDKSSPESLIDTQNFDPRLYYDTTIKSKSFIELLRLDNDLVTESRIIDSQRKTLIYTHYTKFLNASETIGKMTRVSENIREITEELAGKLARQKGLSDSLNERLRESAKEVLRLHDANNLVTKLAFLSELPKRLKGWKETGDMQSAIKAYAKLRPALERYQHTKLLGQISSEINLIMAEIGSTAQLQFRDNHSTVEEANDACSWLAMLGNSDDLPCDLLEIQSRKLRSITCTALEFAKKVESVLQAYWQLLSTDGQGRPDSKPVSSGSHRRRSSALARRRISCHSPKTNSPSMSLESTTGGLPTVTTDMQDFADEHFQRLAEIIQEDDVDDLNALIKDSAALCSVGWDRKVEFHAGKRLESILVRRGKEAARDLLALFISAQGQIQYLPNVAMDASEKCRQLVAGPYFTLSQKLSASHGGDRRDLEMFWGYFMDEFWKSQMNDVDEAAICLAVTKFLDSDVPTELSDKFAEPVDLKKEREQVVSRFIKTVGGFLTDCVCKQILATGGWPGCAADPKQDVSRPSNFALWMEKEFNHVSSLIQETLGWENDAECVGDPLISPKPPLASVTWPSSAVTAKGLSWDYYHVMQNVDRLFDAESIPKYFKGNASSHSEILNQVRAVVLRSMVETCRARVGVGLTPSKSSSVQFDVRYLETVWSKGSSGRCPKYVLALLEEVCHTFLSRSGKEGVLDDRHVRECVYKAVYGS